MNKIRIENKNLYVIEVNDNGDTIEFDFTDPSLPLRLIDCYDKLNGLTKKIEEDMKVISARDDIEINDIITQNQRDMFEINQKYFVEARETLDLFLGNNACKKIFGDKNWSTMFEDLFESLMPEFKKMGIDFKNLQKKMADKYKSMNTKILG